MSASPAGGSAPGRRRPKVEKVTSQRVRDLKPGDVVVMYGTLIRVIDPGPVPMEDAMPGAEAWMRIPMIWNRTEGAPPEQADTLVVMATEADWEALSRSQQHQCGRCGFHHGQLLCPHCGYSAAAPALIHPAYVRGWDWDEGSQRWRVSRGGYWITYNGPQPPVDADAFGVELGAPK
jgi:ribosomal protein L37E